MLDCIVTNVLGWEYIFIHHQSLELIFNGIIKAMTNIETKNEGRKKKQRKKKKEKGLKICGRTS